MPDPWLALGVATVVAAAIGGPIAFRDNWPAPLLAACIALTAVLLSTSIVQAAGWPALYAFLAVLFPIHALAFGALAYRRRHPRYAVLVVVFLALTGVALLELRGGDETAIRALRAVALLGTAASLGLLARARLSAPPPAAADCSPDSSSRG